MSRTVVGSYSLAPFLLIAKYEINPLVKVLGDITAFQGGLVLLEEVLGTYWGRLHQNVMSSLLDCLSFLAPIYLCIKLLGDKRYVFLYFSFKDIHLSNEFYYSSYIFLPRKSSRSIFMTFGSIKHIDVFTV